MGRTFRVAAFVVLCGVPAAEAPAQGREFLGVGRIFSNDYLGDGADRWQTGSYAVSVLRGPAWTGRLPSRPGEILEFRFRSGIAAPSNLVDPSPDDRLFAGTLSVGLHTHFAWRGAEVSAGADIVALGPQTGLAGFQERVHSWVNDDVADLSGQEVDDDIVPNGTAEIGRTLTFGNTQIRPFAEMQAGVETLARVGADLTIGGYGQGEVMLRDVVTGQRYPGIHDETDLGVSLILGADAAHVWDSMLLPDARGPDLIADRYRVRTGLNVGWPNGARLFYGLTWLSEEFEGQTDTQLIGSLSLGIRF